MANELVPVTPDVLDIARELIAEHEDHLNDAAIAFLFWSEGSQSAGRIVLGKAEKVNKKYQALGFDYDFIIFLNMPVYISLDEMQRRALIHHELLHCIFDEDEKASIAPHDLEEFNKIIRMYGFWWPSAEPTVSAVQVALPMMELRSMGRVETLDPVAISRMHN